MDRQLFLDLARDVGVGVPEFMQDEGTSGKVDEGLSDVDVQQLRDFVGRVVLQSVEEQSSRTGGRSGGRGTRARGGSSRGKRGEGGGEPPMPASA